MWYWRAGAIVCCVACERSIYLIHLAVHLMCDVCVLSLSSMNFDYQQWKTEIQLYNDSEHITMHN
jgi:hypothetical protein